MASGRDPEAPEGRPLLGGDAENCWIIFPAMSKYEKLEAPTEDQEQSRDGQREQVLR